MAQERHRTSLVGILNLTPDSFSDGGRYIDPDAALRHAEAMINDGADIIDVGAESTRPGAMPIDHDEEWSRLRDILPPLIAVCHARGVKVSIDTRHVATAAQALVAGVDWINDVGGLDDPDMREALAQASCRIVLMHSLGIPLSRDRVLPEGDPCIPLLDFFKARLEALDAAGIDVSRIVVDPGIGFGKTAAQSMRLLVEWRRLRMLGCPILIGHSRKSFLAEIAPTAMERDAATTACSMFLIGQGVDFLRVHDLGKHATLRDIL